MLFPNSKSQQGMASGAHGALHARCMRIAPGRVSHGPCIFSPIIVHTLCRTRWPSFFASRALREHAPRVTARREGYWGGLDAGPTSACSAPAQVRQ